MNEETKYWINQNGVQSGPLTLDELRQFPLEESAYVWHSDLADWVPVTAVDELKELLPSVPAPAAEAPVAEPEPVVADEPAAEPAVAEEPAPVEGIAVGEVAEEPIPPVPAADETVEGIPVGVPLSAPVAPAPAYGMPNVPVQPAVQAAAQPVEARKCPPTNMVWAVISMLLCCLPLGVVAVVYSSKVSRKFYEGDYEGAERCSETSAWWCIGTIIAGIICQPLLSLIQIAMMG